MLNIFKIFKFKHFFLFLAIVPFLFFTLGIFVNNTHAATGINRQINFQGKLVNNPAATNVTDIAYTVVFTLYNNPNAGQGTALWTETQAVTTTDGIFRVALGSVTAFPANFNFNWTGLYLGIKVNSDSEMTPRVQMAAVPFAFNAEKVAGLTIQDTSGNASTSGTLQVGNTTTVNTGLNNLTFSTGTAGSGSLTINSSGTTSITLPASGTLLTNTTTAAQTITSTQGSGTVLGIADSSALSSALTGFAISLTNSTNSQDKKGIVFNLSGGSSGNYYDLYGSGGTWAITRAGALALSTAYGNSGDCLKSGGSATTIMSWGTCGTGGGGYSPFQELTGVNGGVIVPNNSTEDLLIGGQSSTSAKFAFLNNAGGSPTASISGNLSLAVPTGNNPSSLFNILNGGSLNFQTSPGGDANLTTRLYIANNGNIGIGTTNPQAKLDIAGSSSTISNSSGDITITPTANLIISQGKVGINATSPLATFDIRPNTVNGGTLAVASVSGKTSFAALVVDQAGGNGDIFTASYSGATRFRISQNGSVLIQGQTISSIGLGGTNTTSGAAINAIGEAGSMVPNSGFESRLTGAIADGWAIDSTNSATITADGTTQAKGNSSLKVQLTNTKTAVFSTCIPVAGNTANTIGYVLNWYAKGVVPFPTVRAYVDSYTSQANCMANTSVTLSAAQGATITNAWAKYGSNTTKVTIANTATWAKVRFFVGSGATNAIVNIDGVRLTQATVGSGTDYAENYPADPSNIAEAGDVVSLQSNGILAQVAPTSKYMDDSVIGVVSTEPGQVLGSDVPDPKVAVALAGRVPVKVSTKNGDIHLGDYLASSDIPGVAVKATVAGPVIGTAMEDYLETDSSKIGKIVMFIKNTYFNGISIAQDSGLNLSGKDASVIFAMVKDSQNSQNSISLSLTKDGKFTIKDANGKDAITFDNKGNAFFSGLIIADKIRANQIEGLDIFTNRISALSDKVATLSASLASATGSGVLGAQTEPQSNELTLLNLDTNGLATISADLNVKGNSLIEGALSVLESITTQNLTVSQFAYFINDVVFKGSVRFNQVPTFTSDTAGFAVIKKGKNAIQVSFDNEYNQMPVVTASISLEGVDGAILQQQIEDAILNGNISFAITKTTTKGFVIKLNKPASEDIKFSWVALSVKDAKTSGQTPVPASNAASQSSATPSAGVQSILDQLNNSSSGNGGGD